MCKKVIYLSSMVNVLNLEVCKTYSIRKARKVSLFRDFVLAVFLSVACSLFTAMPAAYGAGGYALEVGGGRTVTIDDDKDVLRLGSYTYEFWMKDLEGPTGVWRNVFCKGQGSSSVGRGPLLALRETEHGLHFSHTTGLGQETTNTHEGIPVNEWTHIALVLTSLNGDQIIFQDGVQVAMEGAPNLTDTTQDPVLRIGLVANVALDDFRVWNYARTQTEIQQDMSHELKGSEEGLVGYWKFNEGEGKTAYDSSPNEQHGTIVGAYWTKDAAPIASGPPPASAYDPSPANGMVDVPRDVVLSWKPGAYTPPTNGHKVYFSESFNDVNDGIGGVTQSADSYTPAQRLDFNKTYYWRVDEVNGPPDFTVHPGKVWSFTTELFSYPIENITATASSQFNANTGPENTINGSGLDENDLHSKQEADIWVSSMTGPQPTWIQYEFDKVYKLHQMWVWNHNTSIEPVLGFGVKDVTVEYSTNGTDWTTLGTTHEFARAPGTAGYAHNTTVDFGGAAAKYVKLTATSNWGGIMPQYGLSEVRFLHIPVSARKPYPDSRATGVPMDVVLSWHAGREAGTHDVYVSTDEQAVIDRTAPVTTVTEASYGPLSLDLGVTHYWRVDEVNEAEATTIWESDVWSFTVSDHVVVDDFESYNDLEPDRIFDTWIDGWSDPTKGGSQVGSDVPPFAEQTIVHSGKQSMPFFYNNTGGAAYSEAELSLSPARDWTAGGAKALSLWFFGEAGNTGQLYVKVNGSKVTYDGDASNLALTGWQAWNINLASVGTNVQNVTKLAIGIDGNGASGKLLFDDIRLYPYERQFITPVEPSSAGLIGHWKFDGNTQDSSGRGNHGTSGVTPAAYVAGRVGSNAMDFRGADYVVIDGVVDDITSTDITLSAWIKTTQAGEGNVFAANDSASAHPLMFGVSGGNPFVNDGGDTQFPPAVNDGQWHLLTYVRSGNTGYIYVDGVQRDTYSARFNLISVTRWSIGQEWDDGSPSDFYNGTVDDARFYDRALSPEEIAWLTGRTTPFDKPF